MFPIGYATVIALQVALGRFSARPVVPINPAGLQPSPPRSPTLDFGRISTTTPPRPSCPRSSARFFILHSSFFELRSGLR